jgi:predicted O-methyltransferase YrrM
MLVAPNEGFVMNEVLARILETQSVTDGTETVSLRHPEFPDKFSHVGRSTGELLQRAVREVKPAVSLEVGLAYGVSTLFICDAIASLPNPGVHIVLDPFQSGKWRGLGMKNVHAAGFGSIVEFHEERSELFLPRLVAEDRRIDLAFIDGLHRFDQALVEFYYINRLLRPGGIVLFDDAVRRGVNRVVRHALTYPAYEVFGTSEPTAAGQSMLGALRVRAGGSEAVQRLVRRDVLQKDWDLGILGRCVALRKISEDDRPIHFDEDF